jgi:hypothetical protein
MKRFFALIIGLVVLAGFSIGFAANPPTIVASDGCYVLDGGHMYTVRTGSSIPSADSIYGTADRDTILRNFVPSPGCEYILALDSISGVYATAGAVRLVLVARSKTGGAVIGIKDFDTLKTRGVPFQTVVPFNQTIIGAAFDIYLAATASTDSISLHRVQLWPRHKYIANQVNGTGMFGN